MPKLSDAAASLLPIFIDRIVPPDQDPGAVEAGVLGFIGSRFTADPSTVEVYEAGLILLASRGFSTRSEEEQDAIITELEGQPSIATMISQTLEGYYAGPESAGARAVGFRVTA
jgi:hypothetical protein